MESKFPSLPSPENLCDHGHNQIPQQVLEVHKLEQHKWEQLH